MANFDQYFGGKLDQYCVKTRINHGIQTKRRKIGS